MALSQISSILFRCPKLIKKEMTYEREFRRPLHNLDIIIAVNTRLLVRSPVQGGNYLNRDLAAHSNLLVHTDAFELFKTERRITTSLAREFGPKRWLRETIETESLIGRQQRRAIEPLMAANSIDWVKYLALGEGLTWSGTEWGLFHLYYASSSD